MQSRTIYGKGLKPLELIKELITASSDTGDLVFDPCIGGGTTAVASIETGRNFLGCEINKGYYDDATKRVLEAKRGNV